jgi:hypothetical protein
MKALAGDHDEDDAGTCGPAGTSGIAGRFFAHLWGLDCLLELSPDDAGCVQGSFSADGEPLEITGGSLGPHGELRGVIRAHDLTEPFAEFRARPDADGLFLELDVTDTETGLETTERVRFVRLG